MADTPIREQSALELLETHAKALEAENARLTRELEIQKQGQNAITNGLCAERDRLSAALRGMLKMFGHPREEEYIDNGPSYRMAMDAVDLAMAVLAGSPVETPEKLWYIECNKCGRQDNPGYGCNALQPDGSRCNGTMRRTRLLFESNFGTPPDPRGAVETAGEPSEVWACVSKGISPPYVRFFESKAEMEAYEWRDDSVSPNRYRPAEKTTPEQS